MSFFSQEQKQQAASGSFEMGGGEPIPENTNLLAVIDEAKWDDYEGDKFIKLRWTVLEGDYKNRKIFHKVKVLDSDTAKADKQRRMLLAIDANAGGTLAKLEDAPSDTELMGALLNKPMVIKVGVWDMNGNTGNWVMQVAPSAGGAPKQTAQAPKAGAEAEDIPF